MNKDNQGEGEAIKQGKVVFVGVDGYMGEGEAAGQGEAEKGETAGEDAQSVLDIKNI